MRRDHLNIEIVEIDLLVLGVLPFIEVAGHGVGEAELGIPQHVGLIVRINIIPRTASPLNQDMLLLESVALLPLAEVASQIFVLRVVHLAVFVSQNEQVNAAVTISSRYRRTFVVPLAFVLRVVVHLLVGDRQLHVPRQIEDVDVAVVVA